MMVSADRVLRSRRDARETTTPEALSTEAHMSWQGYVDSLMGSGKVQACGIYALDGSPWAYSAGFAVSHPSI